MRIDVWFDLVCPFCHVGKRRLELALEEFAAATPEGEEPREVDVIWHSYQLDRNAPAVIEGSNVDRVAAKYGRSREEMVAQHEQMARDAAEVGLDFQWDKAVGGNSFDAHRVIHLARARGLEKPVMERLMRGWYSEGAALGDRDTLVRLAVEAGLGEKDVREMLGSEDYGYDVRADEATANQIGITAVPAFVLDQKFAVTGAQPVDALVRALELTWADRHNAPEARTEGCGGCDGGCACGA
ncbi:putative DsbA family dithiol-disulfide isomerase [Knoellia remsis]|uniref:Putative DsbA family dithiol-disulfide isomerase n=1 Tax=Knoellia remsis TaxID=407159 RepID=A0A2T0UND3_9MICO|nr:DsbA family oxidoreductase [Knoellia remsis]PRY59439.1 putative DsbA family dithiol-disulfide isomerase [Knoellia remsis]